MSFEERIINILNEKNAEIAKIIATEVEAYKASLNKVEEPKPSAEKKSKTEVEVPKVETKTKAKKSVTIETPAETKVEPKKSSKKTSEVEKPKVEIDSKETSKKSKVDVSPAKKTEKKTDTPVDLSTRKCQHTIKSKTLPRLCEKACTNGGEINGVYYCATHFKTASEKINDSSAKETAKPKPVTTTPEPKCQKIENLKLVKGKVGLYFTLDSGDKIIFRLDNKTPVGIGMIPSGGTEVIKMNEHIKDTLEMSNISFDSTKVESKASDKAETKKKPTKVESKAVPEVSSEEDVESGDDEESVEEDKEIQIDADEDDEEDDEDGENDVEDDDEDEIEEEEASEEEESDDE